MMWNCISVSFSLEIEKNKLFIHHPCLWPQLVQKLRQYTKLVDWTLRVSAIWFWAAKVEVGWPEKKTIIYVLWWLGCIPNFTFIQQLVNLGKNLRSKFATHSTTKAHSIPLDKTHSTQCWRWISKAIFLFEPLRRDPYDRSNRPASVPSLPWMPYVGEVEGMMHSL